MNYKEMKFFHSYISHGNNNIVDSFLNPVLKCTKEYKRSVGFFSSGVFDTIGEGIVALSRNGGHMKLIASPKLSEEDVYAINLGYEQKASYYSNIFSENFTKEMEKLDEKRLQLLCELIKNDILNIKIAVADGGGIYHDKLGILRDFEDNVIVFYGSSNSSYSGYRSNYEKIRLTKSWDIGGDEVIQDEDQEFDTLWNNTNKFVEVYDYTKMAEQKLIEIVKRRGAEEKLKNTVKLRDYQEQAITAWEKNLYHGFYVMATGTGKTWTAIFSAKKLVENIPCLITICAPYKHLVKQWAEDVIKVFPNAKIILVSSENIDWDMQISNEIVRLNYKPDNQIIIISTIASFKMPRFENTLSKYKGKKLLIVDEAHRFNIRSNNFDYMLGLSATPYSGKYAKKGNELMQYFGGRVFNLPIEEALERKYLVSYYYRPIYVHATEDEEDRFNKLSKMILLCFKNGVCVDKERLVKTLRNRLRIISMAEAKTEQIDDILNKVQEKDHLVVYCGDGKLYDQNSGEELRHIQSVKRVLCKHEYKSSQFTATESMQERMQLVDSFNKGEISALAAIRCLDEGINIPSIKSALILSSNDDYREFVQRRGRILRTYEGKEHATIYDVIVLPARTSTQWASIELRRFLEYAKLSINWKELEIKLDEMLVEYGLTIDDINVYDYDEMEAYEDE